MIMPKSGLVIAERYMLTRLLACGGMGSVWLARHRGLDIAVAVKLMATALVLSADARSRFEREARLAASLDSQHVVHVQDYGVDAGTPYLVMELLHGESLAARLERDSRLRPPVAARYLAQICKALRVAHELGIVHRDIKPGNIFLAMKDGEEMVKVLDFGIAKTSSPGGARPDTVTGLIFGSTHYMSPEQIRSPRRVDHRSDLWSVGVVLYHLLTGRLPFVGDDPGDVLVRVCTDDCPPPSSSAPELSPAIDAFFERALARDPARRFQSATELAEAFDAVALDPPGPPPLPLERWSAPLVASPHAAPVEVSAGDSVPCGIRTAVWPAITADSAPPVAPTQPSEAPSSPELTPGPISAVLVASAGAESSPPVVRPVAGDRPAPRRSRRSAAMVAVVITVAGIAGAALRHGATPHLAAAETPLITGAPASTAPETVEVPAAITAARGPDPAPPIGPALASASSASAPAPPTRPGSGPWPRSSASPRSAALPPPKPTSSVAPLPTPSVKPPSLLDKQD
jgi:serine/threonine-protein kinase